MDKFIIQANHFLIWVIGFVQVLKKNDNNEFNIRNYEGLSADIDKLPHYENLSTGSSALCIDTGDWYKYEKSTDTWYKIKTLSNTGSGSGGIVIDDDYVNLITEI